MLSPCLKPLNTGLIRSLKSRRLNLRGFQMSQPGHRSWNSCLLLKLEENDMNFDARSLMTTVPNPDDPAIQTLHAGKGTGRGNVITLAVFVLALPALSNRAWADQPTSVLTTVDVPGATLTLARGC